MKTHVLLIFTLLSPFFCTAKENFRKGIPDIVNHIQLANCFPSSAMTDLDIGNVRTKIFTSGDMWWDLVGTSTYEVPKFSGKHSMFAGAIWIGGLANGTALKIAAQTYRQSGSDFWPGPLDTVLTDVNQAVCYQYDMHWRVSRADVANFISTGVATPAILNWPGNGIASQNQCHFLAPFVDINGDGIYNPFNGDYPGYDFSGMSSGNCFDKLQGDQTLWWVFNDMGNVHTETGGASIGLEVHAQAFAYNSPITNLSNTTFYSYKLINRSSQVLDQTYFGQWIDPDLGNYLDDFVGCDVSRGIGYCYNGDVDDDGFYGYGLNPPAIGVDFLKGPLADSNDGLDNDRDSLVDEPGEEIIMSKFVYYNNDFSVIGNPVSANDYYNYLRGIWKDNTTLTYGGDGHLGIDTCDFMFPGNSDPNGWGTQGIPLSAWDEATSGNLPGDRRFLQSAGPFTFQPGAVQTITTAAIWARAASGGPLASVALLEQADDEIQQFFDSCFTVYPTATAELNEIRVALGPNPFHESTTFYIHSFTAIHPGVEFTLYDADGKMVRTLNIRSDHFTLSRNNLVSGVYIYRFSAKGAPLLSGKLLITD